MDHSTSGIGLPDIRHPLSNIRLIATDIDGTLLNSEHLLPRRNVEALRRAVERGVRLVLATARKQATTLMVARMLNLPCACVAHNGARVWDWDGRELRHLTVDLDLARQIAIFADERAIPLILTVNEVNYYNASYPLVPAPFDPFERRVASSLEALHAPPTRIIAAGHPGVDLLRDAFAGKMDTVVMHRYYSRHGSYVSAVLTHPRATKEDAVAELCARAGIAAAEVLALGDAEADVGLLRWAGVGVAMGNGMREALEAADWIAPTHDAAGLAVAVERFVLDKPVVP